MSKLESKKHYEPSRIGWIIIFLALLLGGAITIFGQTIDGTRVWAYQMLACSESAVIARYGPAKHVSRCVPEKGGAIHGAYNKYWSYYFAGADATEGQSRSVQFGVLGDQCTITWESWEYPDSDIWAAKRDFRAWQESFGVAGAQKGKINSYNGDCTIEYFKNNIRYELIYSKATSGAGRTWLTTITLIARIDSRGK